MKKTRFFLAALLLMTVLVFAGCGSKDDNHDAIPDDQQSGLEQDIEKDGEEIADDAEDLGDDVIDGAEDLGDDVIDGAEDAADDVKDAVDGDDERRNTDGDVSKNTADNGTYSNMQ